MIGAFEYLYSPYFKIASYADTATLEFWMNMNVNINNSYGLLEYSFDGIIWSPIGYQGSTGSSNWYNTNIGGNHVWSQANTGWFKASIPLNPAIFNTSMEFQLRYNFTSLTNAVAMDGWAIDDFKISVPKIAVDGGLESIVDPGSTTAMGDTISVSVILKNHGSDTLFSYPIAYEVNGTVIANETWSGTLAPDSTSIFTFTTTFVAPLNDYQLCAYTNSSTELETSNDSVCTSIVVTKGKYDAGISVIESPSGHTTIQDTIWVSVRIKNYGTDTLYDIPVEYDINNQLQATETYSGMLAPGDSASYTFATPFVSYIGQYSICARTVLANDVLASNDESCELLLGTGIEDYDLSLFVVQQNYPNPAKQNTTIDFYIPHSGTVKLRVVDMLGKHLISQDQFFAQGENHFIIDISKLKAGVYFYTVEYKKQQFSYKLIITQ